MFIDMPEGRIFANTGGKDYDPSQPTAILVHGAGCDHSIWSGQNRYLAHHGASVLGIDLPGHGRSEGAAIDSIGGLADFLIRLIAAIGAQKPILIGHSMGALASLEAAGRMGNALSGLGLCGVAAKMPVHPALLGAAEKNEVTAAELISGWGHGSRSHRGGNPSHGIWMLRYAIRLIDSTAPGVLHKDLAACNDYDGALAAAGQVACPTLLLLGRGDKMTPQKAAAPLAEAISGASVTVLQTAGHMMMIEDPDGSRKALMALVQRVAKG